MHDIPRSTDKEKLVIWNGSYGIVTMATISRVEIGADGKTAWLDEPFDIVGPFSLDEIETHGRIAFAACIIMSRQRWQDDQEELRRESMEKRHAAHEWMNDKFARFFGGHSGHQEKRKLYDELQHREALNLPIDGRLAPSQIKAAFRRLAQKVHPDVGGSNEKFIRITEARNALLDHIA